MSDVPLNLRAGSRRHIVIPILATAALLAAPSLASADARAATTPPSGAAAAKRSWRGVLADRQLPTPPWSRRTSVRPGNRFHMHAFAPRAAYADEPSAPANIDAQRFASGLNVLCGTMTPLRRARSRISALESAALGAMITHWSKHFGVDPFVVAALISQRSRCRANARRRGLIGLGRIDVATHAQHIRKGRYRYYVLDDDNTWRERALDVSRFEFSARALSSPEANVYFSAALLRVYREQMSFLGRAVKQAAHRHHVSHFVWGDRVRSMRDEELVLLARRRLLRLYSQRTPRALGRYRHVTLQCPLDGYPRKISSGYRAWRTVFGRHRRHRGVDFVSTYGEPIRAAATGKVVFAGAQIGRHARLLTPRAARRVRSRRMVVGGLFVTLDHGRGVRTRYFHMAGYTVNVGDTVEAGQVIGWVGRTGIKESAPHLHFEIHRWGRRLNPARYLRPYLLAPHGRYPRKKKRVPLI